MQIELGQHVHSQDGQEIGKIKHLILDPANGQIKTLVVEKGLFLPDDIEIPLNAIEEQGSDGLRVRYIAEEVKSLPRFDESQYTLLLPEQATSFLGFPYANALWPLGYPMMLNHYPYATPIEGEERTHAPTPEEQEHRQRMAEENAVLSAGDDVFSKDGEKVGEVHRVAFDSATGRPTHLVIRRGWLFHEDKEIPADSIASISDGTVTLKLDKAALESKNHEEHYAVDWGREQKPPVR
ncbi:MAG TPA: PRC-barrel domain-containing protein [Chthonomonadaceae bacterium]|nr:PRC-barrel domain-containing protein [Chthonomonadaceae bacterium]